jgi:tetratricopeptide (TPR) repeat protein
MRVPSASAAVLWTALATTGCAEAAGAGLLPLFVSAVLVVWGLLLLRRTRPAPTVPVRVLGPGAGAAHRAAPGVTTALRLARAFEESGDFGRALASYNQALRLDPDVAEAWGRLGALHDRLGLRDEAVADFREVVRIQPVQAVAWQNLGLLYRRQGKLEDAAAAYREALRHQPDLAEAWYGLGTVQTSLGLGGDATVAFRRAVALQPDHAKAWLALATLHDQHAEHAEAVAAYREAVRLKPDDGKTWYNLGVLLREQGQAQAAIPAFLEAVRLMPRDIDAWYGLGMTYSLAGEKEGLLEVYQQLAIVDPEAAEELSARYLETWADEPDAFTLGPPGSPADAEDHEKGRTPADAWYDIALEYRKKGDLAQAVSAFREVVRFDPAHAKGWYHLGLLCRKESGREEAIRAFREVIRLKPELAEVWYRLGLLLSEGGEREPAREAFREAVRLKKDYVYAWCGLGMTCAALGDDSELAVVEQQLELIDPRVAKLFRESYTQPAEPAEAAAPGKRRRARSHQILERELVANFEKWLRSLPTTTVAPAGQRRRAEGGTPSRSAP